MKINNLSKFVVAVSLALTTFSCSTNVPNNQSPLNSNPSVTENKALKGTIVVKLADLFGASKSGFAIKSYKFDDSLVKKIKLSVYSTDSLGNVMRDSNGMILPEESKTVDRYSSNLSEVTLSVSAGKNKIVTVESLDDKDVNMNILMSVLNVVSGKKTTLNINYGTYPTARVLKTLMESTDANDRMLAYNIDLNSLETFINRLTGYDVNTNTYGGIDPTYLDTDIIVSKLRANQAATNGVSVPYYKQDVQAYAFLDKSGLELTANSGVIANSGSASTTFTFAGKVSAGDIIYVKQHDTVNDLYSENRLTVSSVDSGTNSITVTPALTLDAGKVISSISFPDRQKYDFESKGKLRVTVKNSSGEILRGVKIAINDLTSKNVSSSTEDVSVIENVSHGKWLMKVTAYDGGKTLYLEQSVNITNSTLNQNITVTPSEAGVASIEFEHPDDDENIPLPSLIELNKGSGITIKAHVTMTDHTENNNITWTSSNPSVATVSNGSISSITDGTTTIKAAATDDLTKFVTVNVKVTSLSNSSDAPTISSFTPTFASANTLVLIKGNNFDDSSLTATTVKFNGVTAQVVDVTEEEIKVLVPVGAATGMITVITSEGTVISKDYFAINNPSGNNSGNVNTDGMVYVSGTATTSNPNDYFYMGRDTNEDDDFYPRHKVILKGFYMDKTEITNAQFDQFIQAGGYTNDANWSSQGLIYRNNNGLNDSNARPAYWSDTRFNQPKQPVVGISWYEAEAYAKWLGRRLPTEAEWEYAARGKNERSYPWGDSAPSESNKLANGYFGGVLGDGDGYQYTNEVGKYSNGDSPFGLKDMAGNAYEWVKDNYNSKYYKGSPMDNPQGPSVSGSKVLRGGSWFNHPLFKNESGKIADSLRTYSRLYSSPDNRSNYIGFRTAADK